MEVVQSVWVSPCKRGELWIMKVQILGATGGDDKVAGCSTLQDLEGCGDEGGELFEAE